MTSKLEEISTHLGGLDTLLGGEVGDPIFLPPLIRLMAILFWQTKFIGIINGIIYVIYVHHLIIWRVFFLKPHHRSCRILSQEYVVGFPGRGAYR